MERLGKFKYQSIRDWEGSIRKISQKEYTSAIGHGQYYPPGGALVFQENSGEVAYFLGGARHTKPEHWSMSDIMFKVKFNPIGGGSNYSLDSFDILNPSTSQTSEAPKLVFSSSVTVKATKQSMLSFSVNGKCLQLRGVDTALSNEINVYETLPPHQTTYRTTTYRTPERANQLKITSTLKETLQQGHIPPPMYASTLTPIEQSKSGKAVLVEGNSLVKEASPMEIMLGLKSLWEELSNGDIYLLNYDLTSRTFVWEKKDVEILPRAHHSAMVSGDMLYIFGGVNYVTKVRYDLRPVIINIENWNVILSIIPESFPDISLSGHSFCQIDDNQCIFVGGFNQLRGRKGDAGSDNMIEMIVDKESVVSIHIKSLGSGPIAQASLMTTPARDVFILGGGVQERWALLSQTVAPSAPCSLNEKARCILVKNPDFYPAETVNWLGCDGPCKRWFHAPCVHISPDDYADICKRKKWHCSRSDCK
jgi:hypothetical protein